jgi:hypothetical protein
MEGKQPSNTQLQYLEVVNGALPLNDPLCAHVHEHDPMGGAIPAQMQCCYLMKPDKRMLYIAEPTNKPGEILQTI